MMPVLSFFIYTANNNSGIRYQLYIIPIITYIGLIDIVVNCKTEKSNI